jgi:hypothetical protein
MKGLRYVRYYDRRSYDFSANAAIQLVNFATFAQAQITLSSPTAQAAQSLFRHRLPLLSHDVLLSKEE